MKAGVPASDIVFEITERSDIENYQILQQIMKHYADQGYEIALDDVGAGHSGLNRVVNTTPDYLKADIELVRDIHKYKKKEIMMKLLLDYCNATGTILIAEGIETAEELECLHSLGVHYGQGYFLGKPERTFGNINDEAAEARKALWVEQLSTFATQITDKTGYKRVNSFYTNGEVKVDRPEDADTIEYFFFVETWGYIVLMVKDEPTTLTPEEEAKEREEQLKQERKDAAAKALSEATARAYELRADFVATVSAAAIKKRLADIVALWAYAEYWDDTGWLTEEEIAQATGAETLAEDDEDGEDDAAFTLQAVTDAIGKTPEKALLRMIYARLGDGKSEGYFRSYWNSYTMEHEENEKLDRIYALLVKLGYEMSDDEKALQDGTHALFGEATDE